LYVPDAFDDPDRPKGIPSQRTADKIIDRESVDRQPELSVGILKKPEGFELVVEFPPVAEEAAAGYEPAHQPCRLLHHFDAASKSVARVQDSKFSNPGPEITLS